jgi:hypothetical protein
MTNAVTSIGANGTVAAASPAGSAIATIPAGSLGRAGSYRFTIHLSARAAGAAADVSNVVLTLGASSYAIPFTPAAGTQSPVVVEGVLDGATAVSLNVGGSSSTIAYYGSIQADYIGNGSSRYR